MYTTTIRIVYVYLLVLLLLVEYYSSISWFAAPVAALQSPFAALQNWLQCSEERSAAQFVVCSVVQGCAGSTMLRYVYVPYQ